MKTREFILWFFIIILFAIVILNHVCIRNIMNIMNTMIETDKLIIFWMDYKDIMMMI